MKNHSEKNKFKKKFKILISYMKWILGDIYSWPVRQMERVYGRKWFQLGKNRRNSKILTGWISQCPSCISYLVLAYFSWHFLHFTIIILLIKYIKRTNTIYKCSHFSIFHVLFNSIFNLSMYLVESVKLILKIAPL